MSNRRTTADRLAKLVQGHEALKGAMPNIEESGGPPNGLPDLAEKVGTAPVFSIGEAREHQVTSTGSVGKGDMVSLTCEVQKKGEALRIANGEATQLGACSLGDVAVVCFAQDDNTYLKTGTWTGTEWSLGPTTLLLEGELDKALLIPFQKDRGVPNENYPWYLAVVYMEEDTEETVGAVQIWSLDGLTLTHEVSDLFCSIGLKNLCGAWTTKYFQYSTISNNKYECYLTVVGQDSEGAVKLYGLQPTFSEDAVTGVTVSLEKTISAGTKTSAAKVDGSSPTITIPAFDTQEYLSSAWQLMGWHEFVLLAFPASDGKRYLLEMWLTNRYDLSPQETHEWAEVQCEALMLEGPLPCGAMVYDLTGNYGPGADAPVFFTGLSRLVGPSGSQHTQSMLGVEIWAAGNYYKMLPLWFAEEDTAYSSNIGLVSACLTGRSVRAQGYRDPTEAVAGYSAGGVYKALVLKYHQHGKEEFDPVAGPTVDLGAVGTAAKLVSMGPKCCLCYQKEDDIFLQLLEVKEVLAKTDNSEEADGIAANAGRPGQTIKIKPFV